MRAGAAEPVIISLNDYINTLKAGRSCHLERWRVACGVHAREIEESTITSGVERMFTRFPAHRSADEGTAENLPCELSAWKIRFL